MQRDVAGMSDLQPVEYQKLKAFCDELGQVGQRHDLDKKRLVQGFLYFGAKLAEKWDIEYEIDGTEVTVKEVSD